MASTTQNSNSPIQDNTVTSTTYPRTASTSTSANFTQPNNGPIQDNAITTTVSFNYAETIAALDRLIDGVFEEIQANENN